MSCEGITNLEEADKIEAGDDVQVVIDLLRKKHGQQTWETTKKNQMVNQYLVDEISRLDDISEVSEINKISPVPVDSKDVLKTSMRPYLKLTTQQCVENIDNLKAELNKNINEVKSMDCFWP